VNLQLRTDEGARAERSTERRTRYVYTDNSTVPVTIKN